MSGKPICANCGIEIRWQPTIVDGLPYCCLGCSRGGPCECDYSRLPMTADNTAMVSRVIPAHEPSSTTVAVQTIEKASKEKD